MSRRRLLHGLEPWAGLPPLPGFQPTLAPAVDAGVTDWLGDHLIDFRALGLERFAPPPETRQEPA